MGQLLGKCNIQHWARIPAQPVDETLACLADATTTNIHFLLANQQLGLLQTLSLSDLAQLRTPSGLATVGLELLC